MKEKKNCIRYGELIMNNEIEKKNLKRDWLFYGIVCVASLLIGYLSLDKNFDFDTYFSGKHVSGLYYNEFTPCIR